MFSTRAGKNRSSIENMAYCPRVAIDKKKKGLGKFIFQDLIQHNY